jgi:hypothetical protein
VCQYTLVSRRSLELICWDIYEFLIENGAATDATTRRLKLQSAKIDVEHLMQKLELSDLNYKKLGRSEYSCDF